LRRSRSEIFFKSNDRRFAAIALYWADLLMHTLSTLAIASLRDRRRHRRASFAAVAACFTTLALAGTAAGATWTVTSLDDSGPGSLRDAIASASPGDTVQFQVAGTITLTSGELYIGQNLTIAGPGAPQLAISGNHASRVFEIANGVTVNLSGMTIENGMSPATNGGGGIFNWGTLAITNCTISGNSTTPGTSGGGIGSFGPLTVAGSTISGNSASSNGGGIATGNALIVTDSTVTNNSSGAVGGGISADDGLTLSRSTLSNNKALRGGGLAQAGLRAGKITNSTFSGNVAAEYGGAIFNVAAVGQTAIQNSTIAGNTASSDGGLFGQNPVLNVLGTLLANNSAGNCSPRATSQGYNISDDNTCGFANIGDQNNVPPGAGLDPKGLQNNGGPTQTIALLASSPAVDLIPAASCALATDQRGITRPQGAGCDAGAYELVQTVSFSTFTAHLAIATGKVPGFVLTSLFTLGSGAPALQLQTQTLTLQIANYTLTLPAGSLRPLWNAPNAPLSYTGTINGAHLVIGLISLGDNSWSFDAAGTPVTISATDPVPVTLTIGQNTGTTSVQAMIR
jgi:hypothetical protein